MSACTIRSRLKNAFRRALKQARRRKFHLCLELFAGTGRLAASWSKQGYGSLAFEIDQGPEFDLTCRTTSNTLKGWIASHAITCVWLGTPCTSWSRARRGPPSSNWCSIRSSEHVLGLPHLRPNDLAAVASGNRTAKASGEILRACIRHQVPCALENPSTSMLWLAPWIEPLRHRPGFRELVVGFCQYGARWRKATRIWTWHCIERPSLCRRCCGRRGVCSTTGQPHIVLTGTDPVSKVLWTRRAQAYPSEFASEFSRVLSDSAESMAIHNMTRLACYSGLRPESCYG